MSVEAISWALNLAPVPADKSGKPSSACAFVLVALANHADPAGRDAYPSVDTICRYTRLSERTVRYALDRLEEAGIIRPGNPDIVAAKIPRGDRRPQVWDLAMELIRDDLTPRDLEALERTCPGITARVEAARAAAAAGTGGGAEQGADTTPERGATAAPRGGTGCNERTNGVQPVQERGATVAPEPSNEPSIEPSDESPLPAVGELQHRRAGAPAGLRPGSENDTNPHPAPASDLAVVWQALPEPLRRRIGVGKAQGQVLDAIRAELEHRTAAQLTARINRHLAYWRQNGGDDIGHPVRFALALVRRSRHCPAVECEDGTRLDTGERCTACTPTPAAADETAEPATPRRPRPYDRSVAEALARPELPDDAEPLDGHMTAEQARAAARRAVLAAKARGALPPAARRAAAIAAQQQTAGASA